MEQKHLDTLEFPQVLARLAQHTTFSAGQALAAGLRPSPVLAEVQHRLQETREARFVLDAQGGLPLGGAHDIRPLAHNAARGAVLLPTDLLDIQNTLVVGRRVQRIVARLHERVPLLADLAARIEPCEGLSDEIARCINDRGEVVDHASEKLARVRHDMRIAHERLMDRLNRIVTDTRNVTFLQETLVTQRSGRYVIPIKAEFKGRIRGIVHDTSASGATLFIEPLVAVEMGNQWRQLQLEEEKEVERILAALSGLVADLADELAWTVEALAELDLAFAKAHYANSLDATEPEIAGWKMEGGTAKGGGRHARHDDKPANSGEPPAEQARHPGSTLRLIQARHPLIDPERVVPIDVHTGDDYFVLVLTGPNTGGKTVSLKTVGLMAAMAQSGLHLPVGDGSALSVYEGLFADIGDEQSIEQSLSTFSSHLTNIVQILDEADSHCLVLLDELGAGTDPVEGSALARAILSHLVARRITTLVATHYSELKAYAQTTPGVENASMEFDLETLSPTYRLRVGLPGRSNAFAIAERLGLSTAIVHNARELVSPQETQTETLLAEIEEAHRAAAAARGEAAVMQRRAAEQDRRLASRLAAIDAERLSIISEARAQARQELGAVRGEIEALRAEMERRVPAGLDKEWLAQAQARLAEREKQATPPPPPAPAQEEEPESGEIRVGDSVWVHGLGTVGEVVAVADNSAEVQVGSFRVRVKLDALERRRRPQAATLEAAAVRPAMHPSPGVELDLRGQRVEEVIERLDKYLDDAFLAGLPFVRIIHGKGTGALRKAVRQQLDRHPLVRSHRPGEKGEGEEGVTVAYIAASD